MKKGFTLIELLVVIAIIGILAGIVLINVNRTRNTARNAAIQSALSQLRSVAEVEFDSAGGSYDNVCTSADYNRIKETIKANNGGVEPSCNDSVDAWAAWSPLVGFSPTRYYCVDSTGKATTTTAAPPAGSTQCP